MCWTSRSSPPPRSSTDLTKPTSFTPTETLSGVWELGDGFTMIVGPDQAAIFLEVGYVDGEQTHVIVHAMLARKKFLR